MVRAWYMDTSTEDQRLPHMTDPPEFVDIADIQSRTRVEYFQIDADNFATSSTLQTLRKERGYDFEDTICITEQMPQYEEKIKSFYHEHLHTDEEIRLILDGTGYFDVRDDQDRWIRIEVAKGDMLILPAGIYHRFTLDTKGTNRYDIDLGFPEYSGFSTAKGDMLILPAGIYHRFTLDTKNYIKANRYFMGVPVWTAVNRSSDSDVTDARKNYVRTMLEAH